MATELLIVPEEHLEEVIKVIRTGMKYAKNVSRHTKQQLKTWCDEEEKYLNA